MAKSSSCKLDNIEQFRKIINGIVGDAMDLACANFKPDSPICKEQDKQAPSVMTTKGPGKSVLLPLIKVLSSL
jgi:hypothetical protein